MFGSSVWDGKGEMCHPYSSFQKYSTSFIVVWDTFTYFYVKIYHYPPPSLWLHSNPSFSGQMVFVKKKKKGRQISIILNYLSLKFPSFYDALRHFWLKLDQLFWRRSINCKNIYRQTDGRSTKSDRKSSLKLSTLVS